MRIDDAGHCARALAYVERLHLVCDEIYALSALGSRDGFVSLGEITGGRLGPSAAGPRASSAAKPAAAEGGEKRDSEPGGAGGARRATAQQRIRGPGHTYSLERL